MQLLKLFPPSFDFICAKATPGGTNPDWHTRDRYRLTYAELIRKWADPATIIGLRPLKDTQKLTIDIDRFSKYHAFNNLPLFQELIDCLAEIGLCDGEIVRSSASGGHHLIFVLSETINSFDLACLLYLYLEERGFGVATGQIEIFPNVKSFNSNFNAVRLPFQEGSELLESDFNIVPQSHEENMAYLVSRIENNSNDLDLLKATIRKRRKDFKRLYKQFNSLGNTNIQEWYRDWSETIDMAWTANGQTNDLLGVYCKFSIVFEGITDPVQLWEQVKTKVLAASGYEKFCEHQHEIDRRIREWVRCTLKRYFPLGSRGQINSNGEYQSSPRPRSTVRTEDVKRRIQAAITLIGQQLGELPQKLTDRLSAIIAASKELGQGLSKNTLYKSCYKILWQNAETAKTRQNEQTDTPQTFSHIPDLEKTPKNQPETKTDTATSHIPALMKRYSPEEVNVTGLDSDLGNSEGLNARQERYIEHPQDLEQPISLQGLGTAGAQPVIPEDSTEQHLEHPQDLERSIPLQEQNTLSTVTELVGKIRESNLELEDSLLLEMLHHPQFDRIESLLEIGSQLLRANSWSEVESITKELCSIDKQDLWQSLTFAERSKINALKMLQKLTPQPEIIPEPIPSVCDPSAVAVSIPTPNIEIGTRLRRNRIKVAANRYVEVILNCEVIGGNSLNWTVQSPQGNRYNVSSAALEGGEWEIEIGSYEAGESLPSGKSTPLGIETIVRAIDGFVGKIARIYKYSKEPYAVQGESGEVRRFGFDDLFPI